MRSVSLFLCFSEVNVGEDVVLAEAMVAGAFAAITEIQIGVVRIGTATDGALVDIAFFLFLFFDRFFEVDRLGAMLIAMTFYPVMQLGIDEYGKVQQGDDGLKHIVPCAADSVGEDIKADHGYIQNRQPFHLDGNNEEQQNLCVGEQAGKGQKHG